MLTNIMDSSKSATSVMFSVDAAGSMLPLYVVYKSTQLWDSWTTGGPDKYRYNRTPSEWFDQILKAYKRARRGPIPKEIFPILLKKTLEKLSVSQMSNVKAGFEATGIYPIDREKVLKRLPIEDLDSINTSASIIIPEALHDIFKETRFGKVGEKVIDEIKINNNDKNILNKDDYMMVTHETEYNNINKTEEKLNKKCDKINVNDFVMVKFQTIKKNIEMYIVQVTDIEENKYTCIFLRKNNQMTGFYCFPFIIDEAGISREQIIKKMVVKSQRRGNFKFQ
ncbi:hypothetical protein AGLY_012350 [Aphis glycines]|uniref:Uncharacterized protein n=1 Tax=Aphis glycines TaxID=307491 RepID=A0A6G0TAG3_APHGL|nr:hypothetical protein AGLY_012350 [Aphis glycines]